MEQIYATRLINNKNTRPVSVLDRFGTVICVIPPGESHVIESDTPLSLYARWTEVVWEPTGQVLLTPRPGFAEPDRGSRWTLTALNLNGKEVETRTIGNQSVLLPKGIPVCVGVPLASQDVLNRSLTIKAVSVKKKHPRFVGFLTMEYEVQDVPEQRSAEELEEIRRELDRVAIPSEEQA